MQAGWLVLRFTVDDIRSKQPDAFREAVLARMRQLTEQQDLGITVDSVTPISGSPSAPLALKNDFNKVDKANAEHDMTLSKAANYENETLGGARSKKEARVRTADAETARKVGLLGAEMTNFSRYLENYQRNPALVTSLLQTETFKKVWANAQSTFLLPDAGMSQLRIHFGEPLPPLFSTNQTNP